MYNSTRKFNYKINTMKYLPLNPEIFIQNRKRFAAKMDKNSIAIFNSNDEIPSNGDALVSFRSKFRFVLAVGY